MDFVMSISPGSNFLLPFLSCGVTLKFGERLKRYKASWAWRMISPPDGEIEKDKLYSGKVGDAIDV
ncbi:MAG TPA: hypothetical protein PKA10_18250 [Selenomonadales bacterium]|nr:hypothetical protein [Selenomonadales bacterium]